MHRLVYHLPYILLPNKIIIANQTLGCGNILHNTLLKEFSLVSKDTAIDNKDYMKNLLYL